MIFMMIGDKGDDMGKNSTAATKSVVEPVLNAP